MYDGGHCYVVVQLYSRVIFQCEKYSAFISKEDRRVTLSKKAFLHFKNDKNSLWEFRSERLKVLNQSLAFNIFLL